MRACPSAASVAPERIDGRAAPPRLELAERVAKLTWDLGGLTYEMAVRDHYRLDVLARRAAELQEADAQLGEVQRLLASAEAGWVGSAAPAARSTAGAPPTAGTAARRCSRRHARRCCRSAELAGAGLPGRLRRVRGGHIVHAPATRGVP